MHRLGPTWRHLSAPLASLARCARSTMLTIFAPPWPILAPPWHILALSWGILAPSWHFLAPSWTVVVPSWAVLANHVPSWLHLGPSWQHLGTFCRRLGRSLPRVAPSGRHLGPSWAHLGLQRTSQDASQDEVQHRPQLRTFETRITWKTSSQEPPKDGPRWRQDVPSWRPDDARPRQYHPS